jgi:WD40 repeat protein
MVRAIIVIVLGVALAAVAAWQFNLIPTAQPVDQAAKSGPEPANTELGPDLYVREKFTPIEMPERRASMDPIVLHGLMNAFEVEELSSKVQGSTVLYIGEKVDEVAMLVAGSAPFLAEPYYPAKEIDAGRQKFQTFYRRLYEGETVKNNQMLGMVDPPEALGVVLEKIAKIEAAKADLEAAKAGEIEGKERLNRAKELFRRSVIPKEDLGAAELTYSKLKNERASADEKLKLAWIDKDQADVKLRMHELRAVLPYKTYTIKAIHRPAGSFLKQIDPIVMTVQSLERLLAEASIEEQYFARIKDKKHVTATIEPTIMEAPTHELNGHNLEVTCVAVAKDMRIVSGSEDKHVCVWKPHESAMHRQFEHDEPVKSLACTPVAAKDNLCIVGCGDGSIWVWDLDGDKDEPIKKIDKKLDNPHGDNAITALAFSPNGVYFASGAADGSICLWTTATAELKYAFVPKNGVAVDKRHEDAVTALHFTPQSRLISAGRDKTLRVWNLKEKGATPDGKALRDRDSNVRSLGVSENGQWMLFDQGRTLRFLSVENHKLIHSINLPPNSLPFDTLATFSPDGKLLLTAGAPEGRLQLWSTPTAKSRGYEVREFAPRERDRAVACAAFSPNVTIGDVAPFAVSGSGQKVYLWKLPTEEEVEKHLLKNVPLTIKSQSLDPGSRQTRVGFEVPNPSRPGYPNGRFEAGRPVTIVID